MQDAQSENWFYGAGKERKGPFTAEQMQGLFRAGTVGPSTLVWSEGMATWATVGQSALARQLPLLEQPAFAQSAQPAVSSFSEAVSTCFQKYATFSGRANRPECWNFILFFLLASFAATVADLLVFGQGEARAFSAVTMLALLLPYFAALIRRLHDTDRSGWWLLLSFVPFGIIVVIVFLCQRGTEGRNRFD